MTFWKRQNFGDSKIINSCQRLKNSQRNVEDFESNETTLYGNVMMDLCHYLFAANHRMYYIKREPKVNYGFGVTMSM